MLNRSKLIRVLEQSAESLFPHFSNEYEIIRASWNRIVNDPTFRYKIQQKNVPWIMPQWSGTIDDAISLEPFNKSHCIVAVDGSQIYPDRHQGSHCFLINIGSVVLAYGIPGKRVFCDSEPYLFVGNEDDISGISPDIVNCRREEYEFEAGLTTSCLYRDKHAESPLLFLFDGSLIFWHLETKDQHVRDTFLMRYCSTLQKLYNETILCAGYISLPRSKELINLIRFELCGGDHKKECNSAVEHFVDSSIAHFFLKPFTRSILFKHCSAISDHYPKDIKPYFFYLHVGSEIVRIEVPAWIAHDEEKIDLIAQIIIDQAVKGRGYPVSLAEAHEQAVIKGPDRDFFYHLINKMGIERKRCHIISQKSLKKRGIGI